mmetsp:Transcript_106126/g.295323  ORF Transcript_106126/g.295323 Transcript_106126/m.295323 type:complete len:255 (+) Transcript_106126:1165-1929(+)
MRFPPPGSGAQPPRCARHHTQGQHPWHRRNPAAWSWPELPLTPGHRRCCLAPQVSLGHRRRLLSPLTRRFGKVLCRGVTLPPVPADWVVRAAHRGAAMEGLNRLCLQCLPLGPALPAQNGRPLRRWTWPAAPSRAPTPAVAPPAWSPWPPWRHVWRACGGRWRRWRPRVTRSTARPLPWSRNAGAWTSPAASVRHRGRIVRPCGPCRPQRPKCPPEQAKPTGRFGEATVKSRTVVPGRLTVKAVSCRLGHRGGA